MKYSAYERESDDPDLIPLGRNKEPVPQTPNLHNSELFPGMQAVQPDEHGFFENRTGRNERKKVED